MKAFNDGPLREYLDFISPITEAPTRFHRASALGLLGAAVGRRAFVQYGPHTTYPTVPLVLIAPSGVGKSEALNVARRLFRLIRPDVHTLGDEATPEAVVEYLSLDTTGNPRPAHKDSELAIFAGELSTLIDKRSQNTGMLPILTKLFEYDETHKRALIKKLKDKSAGSPTINAPTLSLFGGSTIAWLRDMMPSGVFSGGFLRRLLIVCETRKSKTLTEWPESTDFTAFGNVAASFINITQRPLGEFVFTDPTKELFMGWKAEHDEDQPTDERLAGHHNSLPQHVLRSSLLSAIARGRRDINPECLDDGVSFAEELARDAGVLLNTEPPAGDFSGQTRALEAYLAEKGGVVARPDLIRHFRLPTSQMTDILEWAISTGTIAPSPNGTITLKKETKHEV